MNDASRPTTQRRFHSRPMAIFLAFALGIVIPSSFLSYLGFRSYQYENTLLRKDLEERYHTVAELMERKSREAFQKPLETWRQFAAQEAFQRWQFPRMTAVLVSDLPANTLSAEFVAVFDSQDHMIFPLQKDVRGIPAGPEPEWGPYAAEFRRLESLEFGQKNLPQALDGYQALLRQPLNSPQRIALLTAAGSAAAKLGKVNTSEKMYQALIQDYDTHRDPTGEPVGLQARKLLAQLYEKEGRLEQTLRTWLDMYEGLSLYRWGQLPSRQEWLATLRRQIESHLKKTQASTDIVRRWHHSEQLQIRLNALQAKGDPFLQTTWPDAMKRLRRNGWVDQGGILRLENSRTEKWLIAVPVMNRTGEMRQGLLVSIIEPAQWQSQMQTALTDVVKPLGLQFTLSDNQNDKKSGWRAVIHKELRDTDPPLRLTVYAPISSTQDQLTRKRLWIYGGMVGLSLLVIIIGLWMMGLAVRREVEIAQLKSDFVANVSHELRTPLSAIAYIAERLNRGRYRSEDEAKDFYVMLREEAGRLQELIEDILDFSKMLGGKKVYRKEQLDLGQTVGEAIDRLRGKAEAGGFRLRFSAAPTPVFIDADRKAVVHAVTNLIDNAMKYSGQSHAIEISVRQENGRALAEVTDHGIGIPPAEKERIFEKFYRVEHGAVREAQGVGLGLALVQHIMESHEGQIQVKSEPGQGSVFSLVFPLSKQKGKAA